MTDNEIIKALECCIKDEFLCDSECPGQELDGDYKDGCRISLMKKALDLISRQNAEIERWQSLQKPTGAGGYKVENGKVVFYSDMLNGYRHEYKDLDEVVKELNLYMHTDYKNIELISHYKHKEKTAKSEAIKEFAEKLPEIIPHFDDGHTTMECVVRAVKNLVKEMVGENK